MRYLLPIVLLLGIFVAIFIGTDATVPRADLTFNSRGSIHTLDPAQMSYMQDIRAALALWEGLTTFDPVTTQAIEGCAYLPPEMSADGKKYIFTLRPEAKWSNGDAVVAADFIRAWRRAIEPGTSETYAELIVAHIAGASEYVRWRTENVGALGLIRQLQKRSPIKPADARRIMLSVAGSVVSGFIPGGIPNPPPEQDDLFWKSAVEQLAESKDWKTKGDALLDEHLKEMDARFAQVGIRATDDHHLEVRLSRPTAYFLDLTAFSTYLPVHNSIETLRESYESRPLTDAGLWSYHSQWTKPDYDANGYPGLITNGAYRLTNWAFKQRLRLEINSHYWRADHVRTKTIDMLDIEYANTAFMLYEQGHIDWLTDMTMDYTPELVRQVRQGKRDDIHNIPSFGTFYYVFNCRPTLSDGRPNPFADPRVRRAMNRAIDKQALVDHVERLGNPVATTFIPRGQIPGYPSPAGLPYDPELARRELGEAGYKNGEGLPTIDILFNTGGSQEAKVQALARMWKQELGLKISLIGKETKTFAEDKDRGRFVLARAGWFGDYNDPTTFLDLFQSTNGNNVGQFIDTKYDDFLAQAANEVDSVKRMQILSEAERYIMEEQMPIVPLFVYVSVYAWRPNVTGITPNPRLQFPLQYIEVKKNLPQRHRERGARGGKNADVW